MKKPRILFLTQSDLRGDTFGGQMRDLNMVRALQEMAEVRVVFVDHDSTPARPGGADPKSPARVDEVAVVRESPLGLNSRMRSWLDPRCIDLHGCSVDASDRQKVLAMLPEFDLVWIHLLRTANVFGQWHWPRSVMDLDDIPSSYLRSVWQNATGFGSRMKAAGKMAAAWRREKLLEERFTVLSVCSNEDREYLGNRDSIHVIPNGFDRPAQDIQRQPASPPRIGFIGLFDFAPNLDGMRWFARECWPLIKNSVHDARLRLVGKGSEGNLKPSGPDIDGLGWVADPAAEIATWSMMIVPIRIGAGTRVKIAEAFSRKCPVVSTSLGAYGYAVIDGEQLRLADRVEDFAGACISLIANPDEGTALANRAWKMSQKELTWESIAPRIRATAEDCLRRSHDQKSGFAR